MKKRFFKAIAIFLLTALLLADSSCLPRMGTGQGNGQTPAPVQSAQASQQVSPAPSTASAPAPSLSPSPSAAPSTSPAPSPSAGGLREEEVPEEEDFAKLAPTTVMSFAELVGDNGDYGEVKDYPPADTYKIVVNVYYQFITVYKKDASGNFSVPVRYMVCSSGSHSKPTPTGKFKLGKEHHRFGKFVTYGVFGQYWTQVTRNIFFHSLLYTARNAKTYTKSSYKNLGKRASHGCIRLLVPDARWIYYNAAPGTAVEILRGKKDEKLAAIKGKLVRAKLPSTRPNLKPGKIHVTEPWPGYTGPVSSPQR